MPHLYPLFILHLTQGLLTAAINFVSKQVRVFVPISHFHHCLTFSPKALINYVVFEDSKYVLHYKYQTRVEVTDYDILYVLLRLRIYDGSVIVLQYCPHMIFRKGINKGYTWTFIRWDVLFWRLPKVDPPYRCQP